VEQLGTDYGVEYGLVSRGNNHKAAAPLLEQYLGDISKYPRLTAQDEKRLFSILETFDSYLALVFEDKDDRESSSTKSSTEVVLYLLGKLAGYAKLGGLLSIELQLPPSSNLLDIVQARRFNDAINGQLDTKIVSNITSEARWTRNDTEQFIADLSLCLRLLPRIVLEQACEKTRWWELRECLSNSDFVQGLITCEDEFQIHYQKLICDGIQAREKLINCNLRLVASVARQYAFCGIPLLDLIQEGNIGLMHAIDKFEYRTGNKLSTYATWWIRQAVTRAICDTSNTIRIPVHMVETIRQVTKMKRLLEGELSREPTCQEIGNRLCMPSKEVERILRLAQKPVSLEGNTNEEDGEPIFGVIEGNEPPLEDQAAKGEIRERLEKILSELPDRESRIIKLRFGLTDGRTRTLEEIGNEFSVTRERIRQIEAKALRKLRHPSRTHRLKDYLD